MRPLQPSSIALHLFWLAACAPAPSLPTSIPTLPPPPSVTATASVAAPVPPLAIAPPPSGQIERYGLLELDILTNVTPQNPYDPDELDLRVEFSSPSGSIADVGAFWYQEYEAPYATRKGPPGWKVRFTPTETGTWTAVARIEARGLQSAPFPFRVLPSESPGFVRVHPNNPRYLAFDNGDFFFPIGLNIGWWTQTGDALTDYRKWMGLFAAQGGNTIRVWMAEWSFGLEWNDTPLGDYDNRLRRAWMLDQIFAMADSLEVYVDLVLLNCADFNNWQTNGWYGNPYNAARLGPLERPEQFVTDPAARALLQRRLNYIVNRWGYSPRLLAWEWWNEVNLAPFSDEALTAWLQEMTAYLRERDVNRHLTTNSYAIRDLSPIWALPEIDIIQKHEYSDQTNSADRDLAERAAPDLQRLAASAPPKPILLGEFGYGGEDRPGYIEKTGIHLHNGLWSTTFAGYAGSGMYWFWDIYIEANRLWYHFRGLDRFLADEDLSGYEPFSPLHITGPDGAGRKAVGLGLRGEELLVWLRSDAYTVQASEEARDRAGSPSSFLYNPPSVEGQVLSLHDMTDGEYSILWYDPQAAKWLNEASATARDGLLVIAVPTFRRDLAAKVIRRP
jgi:Domain of unknown function (DUF5060)